MDRIARQARIAGIFYLFTFITGFATLLVPGTVRSTAGLIAAGCYLVVTWLFYHLFKPVSQHLSLVAALLSVTGLILGPLRVTAVNPFVFFGVYCLLIGYFILRSNLLPRTVGVLMLFAGLGWLTFASPTLAKALYPLNFLPGIIGEGSLTVALLVAGVNVEPRKAPLHT